MRDKIAGNCLGSEKVIKMGNKWGDFLVSAQNMGLLSLTSGIYLREKKAFLSDFFRRFATRTSLVD